jgi:hypothetical protein
MRLGMGAARERCQRAYGAEHATHDVVDARTCPQRAAFGAGHVGQATHHLHHLVERGAVLIRPGQEALVRDVDQALVQARQRLGAEAQALHRAALEVLAEDIGTSHEPEHDLAAARVFHVDRQALLVSIEQAEEAGSRAQQPARVVACQRLDLDDLGAQVGQDHPAGRPHHHVGELDDPQAGQRQRLRLGAHRTLLPSAWRKPGGRPACGSSSSPTW